MHTTTFAMFSLRNVRRDLRDFEKEEDWLPGLRKRDIANKHERAQENLDISSSKYHSQLISSIRANSLTHQHRSFNSKWAAVVNE